MQAAQWTSRRRNSRAFAAWRAQLAREFLLRAGDCVLLIVKQFPDSQGHLDILSTISPLPGSIFLRRQHRKLGLPISEHVRLHTSEFAYLSNLEEKLLGDRLADLAHRCRNLWGPERRRETMYRKD